MMTEAKFTPGPWHPPHFTDADTTCDCGHVFSEHQEHMGSVCTVRWDKDDLGFDAQRKSEAIANAHLIASAPDLYGRPTLLQTPLSKHAHRGSPDNEILVRY